ncbi:glycosyltransferase family 2 protein [Desulfonauticus submarinus]
MKILCFSPYAKWKLHALYEITIAHALKLRGSEVNFITCDGAFSECDIFWQSTNPRQPNSCLQCQAEVANLFYMMDMPYKGISLFLNPEDFQQAKSLVNNAKDLKNIIIGGVNIYDLIKSSVHSHFRCNKIDLKDKSTEDTVRRYLYSGILAFKALSRAITFYNPDVLLLFNGRMYLTRIAFELARDKDIDVVVHERGLRKNELHMVKNFGIQSYYYYILSRNHKWKDVCLSDTELKRVYKYLEDRMFGRSLAWKQYSSVPHHKHKQNIINKFKINKFKKVIILFTSSQDEIIANIDTFPNGFKSQKEWIEHTILFFKKNPQYLLIIRVHPNTGGKKATGTNKEQVDYFIELKKRLKDINNIKLILPEDDISSYTLIDIAHLGLVYLSTIGLEMACRGKQVIICENAFYANNDFVITVDDKHIYLNELINCLNNSYKLNWQIAKGACRLYNYLLHCSIPFPLIEMTDIHTAIPKYNKLDALLPGKDKYIDKICNIILGKDEDIVDLYNPHELEKRNKNEKLEIEFIKKAINIEKIYVQTKPLVSIIIPCYNYGRYLPRAVKSVVDQTFPNWELIIVNDGSTDNTSEIAKQLIQQYDKFSIKLIEQENSGQPAIPRNNGIKLAKGKYILCLDPDDMLLPTMLEECVRILELGYGLVYTGMERWDKNSFKFKRYYIPPEYNFNMLKYKNHVPTASIFLKEGWKKVGGYRINVVGYEDWDFWIALGSHGYDGILLEKPLFRYFEGSGLYNEAKEKDSQNKANIVLNNKQIYSKDTVEWAYAVLKNENWSLYTELGEIPDSSKVRKLRLQKHTERFTRTIEKLIKSGYVDKAEELITSYNKLLK